MKTKNDNLPAAIQNRIVITKDYPRIAYSFSDFLALFGTEFTMFGPLVVGVPECDFCGDPATQSWLTDMPGREHVLFTCEHPECE